MLIHSSIISLKIIVINNLYNKIKQVNNSNKILLTLQELIQVHLLISYQTLYNNKIHIKMKNKMSLISSN